MRKWFASAFWMLVVGVFLLLGWLGNHFVQQAFSSEQLTVDPPPRQKIGLGSPLTLNLTGAGFDDTTSACLMLSVNNPDALVASLPLEGIFNTGLVDGDYLYLGSNNDGLKVLDISRPRQPRLIKEFLYGRPVVDLHRTGNLLFVSTGRLGFSVMWISDSGVLFHVIDIPTEYSVTRCASSGDFLFAAAGANGVQVYDISRIKQARLVNILEAGATINALTVYQDYLYLASTNGPDRWVDIYRLSNPREPVLAGRIALDDRPNDMVVHDNRLYLATSGGVFYYRLDQPESPELSGAMSDFGSAEHVFPGPRGLYVVDGVSGLHLMDYGTGKSLGNMYVNGDLRTVSEASGYLYVAGAGSGLQVIAGDSFRKLQSLKTIHTSGNARDLFFRGEMMFVADSGGGVLFGERDYDPVKLASISSRRGKAFAATGQLLFVAQEGAGLELFNISDPRHPVSVAHWPEPRASRLVVQGNYLIVSKGFRGLEVLDISDPYNPLVRDSLQEIHALQLYADERLIYATSEQEGLVVFRIDNDGKILKIGQLSMPFPMNHFALPTDVKIRQGIAYIANGRSGLLIADVGNPEKPSIIASMNLPGISKGLTVAAGQVFVSSSNGGLSVIDVSVPEQPVLSGFIPFTGLARDIHLEDKTLYLTLGTGGILALPVPVQSERTESFSQERIRIVLPSPTVPGSYSLQVRNRHGLVSLDNVLEYY